MNCADFPGECLCGSIDFERIVVQRKPNAPITTDFVACLACRAMYFVPLPPIVVTPREGRPAEALSEGRTEVAHAIVRHPTGHADLAEGFVERVTCCQDGYDP